MDPTLRPVILKKVARATHGFVPTDLQALCTESALQLIAEMSTSGPNIISTTTPTATIDFTYFERALKTIRPSGMGEYQTKIPAVTFDQLYGIKEAITDLRISIIEPFNNPQKYIDLGISPPRGVIVHGPPGVGKTMLCCALAEELGINFMLVEVNVSLILGDIFVSWVSDYANFSVHHLVLWYRRARRFGQSSWESLSRTLPGCLLKLKPMHRVSYLSTR